MLIKTFSNLFRIIVQCLCVHPPCNFGCRTRSHWLTLDVVFPVRWQRLVAAQYGRTQRFNWKKKYREYGIIYYKEWVQYIVTRTNLSIFLHFVLETRYVLGGPGIEAWWRRDFPHPSRPDLWPIQPPPPRVPGFSPGIKAAGAWCWPLTPIYCQS
jgi:hypothetical protein